MDWTTEIELDDAPLEVRIAFEYDPGDPGIKPSLNHPGEPGSAPYAHIDGIECRPVPIIGWFVCSDGLHDRIIKSLGGLDAVIDALVAHAEGRAEADA